VLAVDSEAALAAEMRRRCAALGGACFAEEFIDGREFNLSLLAGADRPEVLPPAEILFSGYTPDMVRIVDYRAKWDEGSFHYHHTPRTFEFGPEDAELLQELTEIARNIATQCMQLHGGYGYMEEYKIARRYRDIPVASIYAGTNDIMKTIIAKNLGL